MNSRDVPHTMVRSREPSTFSARRPLHPMQHENRHSSMTASTSHSEKVGKFDIKLLWQKPKVNAITGKARSIPILNPFSVHGRVFHFSWFGFWVAFWSWYAFPPLLTITIAKDVGLTPVDIANSNITALLSTLIVRLTAGLACDRFGARYTFAAILLAGSIPTVLAGTVTSANGLIAVRFFVGILGGAFIPCQVWTTAFFDKNCVGTATSLAAGWGNSGGGITYFIMPAIFDSLVYSRGYSAHISWRVAFVVPFIVIVVTAIAMLLLCPDTPLPQGGRWSARHAQVQRALAAQGIDASIVIPPKVFREPKKLKPNDDELAQTIQLSQTVLMEPERPAHETTGITTFISSYDAKRHEQELRNQEMIDIGRGEIVQAPTRKETINVIMSAQTLVVAAGYFCSFGSELALNSILGAYYLTVFPTYGQTGTGRWAAMFGLLNIVTRPLGGMLSDALYNRLGSLWAKKLWLHGLGVLSGGFLIVIGLQPSRTPATIFGLFAGAAFFIEAGNGANFSLVAHVHPYANGIIAGLVGAAGNLGGIIFAIIFRAYGEDYTKVFWIIGIMQITINLAVSWIQPIPKGQIGGR